MDPYQDGVSGSTQPNLRADWLLSNDDKGEGGDQPRKTGQVMIGGRAGNVSVEEADRRGLPLDPLPCALFTPRIIPTSRSSCFATFL